MKACFVAGAVALLPTTAAANDAVCSALEGAKIIAQDGQYLGSIANPFSADSIFNKFGTYGSKFSSNSIWNKFGTYGSEFSSESPFNKSSSDAPIIVKNREVIATLSVNRHLPGAVDPRIVGAICYNFTPD